MLPARHLNKRVPSGPNINCPSVADAPSGYNYVVTAFPHRSADDPFRVLRRHR